MLRDIVAVQPLEGSRLHLRFDDGIEGSIDVAELVEFKGIFESLQSRECFDQMKVNSEFGTICWPNNADLDPDVLYAKVTGQPLPDFEQMIKPYAAD